MINRKLLEIRRHLLIFSGLLLIGCSAPSVIQTPAPEFGLHSVQVELHELSEMEVELEESRWWEVSTNQQPILFRQLGGFHGRHCQPRFRIIATLAAPPRHPFIRENPDEANRTPNYFARSPDLSFIKMDLTEVSLDELEEAFIRSALPRSEWKQRTEPPFCGWVYSVDQRP